MKEFIQAADNLPMILKVILAIPALDIVWGIYRIVCALDAQNITALVISIILMFIPVMWIIDIIFIIMRGGVWRYQA